MINYLERSVRILQAMEDSDFASYDWYDFWSTQFGLVLSRAFQNRRRRSNLKFLLAAPAYLALRLLKDYFPFILKPFTRKTKSATTVALAASSYFMIYKLGKDKKYLDAGKKQLAWLEKNASKGYAGYCWGLPFDWQCPGILFRKGTPCSTIFTYIIEAFQRGYALTKDELYLKVLRSITDFLIKDLNYTEIDKHRTRSSYTPLDNFAVVNASSYVAASLYLICSKKHIALADKLVNYVLSQQNPDGSWDYWEKGRRKKAVVDSLHQCYIIENLYLCYLRNRNGKIKYSLLKAIAFFENNLIQRDYSVRFSTTSARPLSLITHAETITMLSLLSADFNTMALSEKVLRSCAHNFRMKSSCFFMTSVAPFMNVKVPYFRWGQAQIAYAMVLHARVRVIN